MWNTPVRFHSFSTSFLSTGLWNTPVRFHSFVFLALSRSHRTEQRVALLLACGNSRYFQFSTFMVF
jgi:hypothetical protein